MKPLQAMLPVSRLNCDFADVFAALSRHSEQIILHRRSFMTGAKSVFHADAFSISRHTSRFIAIFAASGRFVDNSLPRAVGYEENV